MRVYHFLSADSAIDDVQKRHIKLSRFEDMNDPFELLALDLKDEVTRFAFLKLKQDMDSNRGVVCFSKNWHNPLLWSHYADKHRGICLGFDIDDTLPISMIYDGKRIAHDLQNMVEKGLLNEEFMIRIMRTKFEDWAYEEEIRVFANLDEPDPKTQMYFKDFDEKLQLREIILGARFDEQDQRLKDINKYVDSGVMRIKARLSFDSFRIVES